MIHHSVYLNKVVNTLKKREDDIEQEQKRAVDDVICKVADHLFANIATLDTHSVLQTLKLCAYSDYIRVKPTR